MSNTYDIELKMNIYDGDSSLKDIKQNRGDKTFLKKWGFTTKFFKKHYLKSKTKYDGPLKTRPIINFKFFVNLFLCKIKFFFLKLLPIKL